MRIVIFNDRKSERDALVKAIATSGYSVEAVGTEEAALAAIMREPPQIIVFAMPGKGAAGLVKRLSGADATGQAYLLALCDTSPTGRELVGALEAGAHDFLRRPWVPWEFVERLKGPARAVRWSRALTSPAAFDGFSPIDVSRLEAWQNMGSVVALDFAAMAGAPCSVERQWPSQFEGVWRAATISMSLAGEQLEVRVSVVADAGALGWIKRTLLGDADAADESADDALRELANTAGGALKRAALAENVTLTTGIPRMDDLALRGDGHSAWTLALSDCSLALVGEIRQRSNQRLSAAELSEGMIPAYDVRNEDGILLVPAGTRLTATTALRLSRLLGSRFFLEVAPPA